MSNKVWNRTLWNKLVHVMCVWILILYLTLIHWDCRRGSLVSVCFCKCSTPDTCWIHLFSVLVYLWCLYRWLTNTHVGVLLLEGKSAPPQTHVEFICLLCPQLSNLGIMTVRLLPALLDCFKSEYVSVRIEAAMVSKRPSIVHNAVSLLFYFFTFLLSLSLPRSLLPLSLSLSLSLS